jgi:hypothetical protein
MVTYEKTKPYLKRVPTIVNVNESVQRYDQDNLYPQRAKEVLNRSYTLKSVMSRVADFLNGEGFRDEVLAKMVLNDVGLIGQTGNDVLNQVVKDFASFKTIAVHIGYNLNFRISSITPVPFEYCRLGLPDQFGEVKEIKYSTNWERDSRKETKEPKIETYSAFDPSPDVVKAQIELVGIENYKGQILYHTPDLYQYPLASFDPVIDHAQAQGELGMFKVSNVQNQFLATLAVMYSGEFESEEEKQAFKDLIANKSGARNAGTRIGLQDKTGTKKVTDMFANLSPTNIDKLYEFTEKSVMEAIMENEAMPKELLGVRPESGMFNQANMEQAYVYYNSITRNRRAEISRLFSLLLSYWETPIQTDAFILPQRYLDDTIANQSGLQVNDNLKNMTGMQAVNFARILRKYGQKKYDRPTAETMLRSGFGLTEDEIKKLLDAVDQSVSEEGASEEVIQNLALKFL